MIMTNDISLCYMASTAWSSACLSRYMYAFLFFICDINVLSVPSTNMNNSLFKMCRWQRSLPVLMRIKPLALQFSLYE